MEGFCRGCLVKYDELMDLLQYTEKNRRLFVYSTGLQVKRNDTFTFQICKDCYLNMKTACKFKKQCRASDKLFKNYMALKESGENVNFQSFLKTHDESLTFRLPMLSGNLTPSNQRLKEDDNESTTTSIRNFMTDILHDEEIPVTEARIIQEVIEEEADVLDDSLDSHWLQDDVSIDTDFGLDFSFSPFSSPKSTNGQYTPIRSNQRSQEQYDHNYYNPKQIKQHVDKYKKYMSDKTEINELAAKRIAEDTVMMDTQCNIALEDDNKGHFYANSKQINEVGQPSQYVSVGDKTLKSVDKALVTKDTLLNNTECSIDKNLKIALKDENNKEFAVEDLICSPQVFARVSSPTPFISKILFGDKNASSDLNKATNQSQPPDKGTHNSYNENGDVDLIEEFLAKEEADKLKSQLLDKEVFIDDEGNETFKKPPSPIQNKYDEETIHCKICDKKYQELRFLRTHFVKVHKISIGMKTRQERNKKHSICPVCGKEFNDVRNYHRHVKNHAKLYTCPICSLKYKKQGSLKNHMKTHGDGTYVMVNTKPPKEKPYLCNFCGLDFVYKHNYKVHLQRHNKTYVCQCHYCSKQFCRKTELIRHIRVHTSEKPYKCKICPKTFTRTDRLSQHMKYHTGERPFECTYCSLRFVTNYALYLHMNTSKRCLKLRSAEIKEEPTEELDLMTTEN